ncbi:MAG: substrate-binding domain-containing protein [Anaerolineae bacterium]|nr:substrate-binding domain-containing protein [Anaerolineae bacterium]
MRQRGTIFIVLFILIAVAIVGVSRFMGAQPPVEYTLAVDPLAQAWADSAVTAFNASQPTVNGHRISFRVVAVDDLSVWQGQNVWTTKNHQDVWLPASHASVDYARANGLSLVNVSDSLARTPMVWGGYISRANLLTSNGVVPLDWSVVQGAADKMTQSNWAALGGDSSWGYLKLGFGQVNSKISGLAALFTAAATFNKAPDLTQIPLSEQAFRDWLSPIVKSRPSFAISGDPLLTMISGPSTIELAMFPEAQWLLNIKGMNNQEEVRVNYPAYQFMLDFPLVRWQDNTTGDADRQLAVKQLGDWLAASQQQNNLPTYGLRPATTEPTQANDLFRVAIQYGIAFAPDFGQAVKAPTVNEVKGLIQWVTSNR